MEHNQYNSRLIKSHYNGDIRRFCLSKDCSFEDFKKSIHYLYGSIPSSHCYRYMDDENDMISITSDKELTEALRFSNPHNDTLKVFVVEKKAEKVEEKVSDVNNTLTQVEDDAVVEEVASVNHEAYCDHCGEDIFGVRYKCANCEDFDLCENCEALWSFELSIHQEDHVFFKIYTPLPSWHSGNKLLFVNLYDGCDFGKDEIPESDKESEGNKKDYNYDESSSSDSDDETASTDDSSSDDSSSDDSSSDDDDSDESSSSDDDETTADSDDSSSSEDEKVDDGDKEDIFSLELQQALTEMDDFANKLQRHYLPALARRERDSDSESSSSDSDTDSDDDLFKDVEKPTEPVINEVPQQLAEDNVPKTEEPVVNDAKDQAKGEFSSLLKTMKWFFGLEVEWDSAWDELLTKTEEMGFSDKEHFKRLILDSRGDLARAIHSHFEQ